MDKFDAMQRFVQVAQSGSFTQAAERLGLPKSSVSQAVTQLEKHLGTRLFHRSTRSVTLTPDGEHYLPQALQLLAELDALDSQFHRSPEQIEGTLRIDMPSRFATSIVLPNLNSWIERYPQVKLKISSSDARVNMVKEGIDCVVRVGTLSDSTLIARPLTHLDVYNLVSPGYIKQFGKPETLAQLSRHRLIDYSSSLSDAPSCFEYEDGAQTRHIDMPSALTVSGTEAYLSACLAGLGIAQIPCSGIEPYLARGELLRILPDAQCAAMPVNLLYPSRRQLPKRVSLFMDWLKDTVDKHMDSLEKV